MGQRAVIGRRTLFAIFTLSGFSGLIYESIWSHYLKLFLGHAAYAQTLVLTVFMGGMAAGAWLTARFSTRLKNLLLAYALVELAIGALALGFHPLYLASTGFTFDHVIPALDAPLAINVVKWLVAGLLILPQSLLLGATFPLISGGVVRRFPANSGATLAMLYFTNSLGAAIGVLTSGFWLIGWVGLPGTVMIAGIVNVLLGALVWLLRGSEPPAANTVVEDRAAANPLTRRLLWVAFLSGVAAFIYEIGWIRMLSLVLGSSTHAFELMLSAFILGLALGGLAIRRHIDALTHPVTALAVMFALMAALAALTLPAYGLTFDVIGAAIRDHAATNEAYARFNLLSHGVAAAVMVPTTFVAGMTLPVITNALLKSADERAIGRVYAANTVGAIGGVLVAVHVLLPQLGLKGTILAGASIQLAVALLLVPRPFAAGTARALRGAWVGAVVLAVVTAVGVQLDPRRMASGVYRQGIARLPDSASVELLRDGKTATISLVRSGDTVIIATNGKPDAAINLGAPGAPNPDEVTMAMAASLPLAMLPNPRQVANIGIGSGMTSSIVLASDRVERLDTIEIEPVMAEAARIGFGARVARVFEDPRSHIHYEDAKTFFSAAKRTYDVIISEPSNPWVSGVATLFSDEFYAQIRRHLARDGLLVQWFQIYETDITVVASIIKALSPHFADYAVYSTDDANILIVARPEGRVPALNVDLFQPSLLAEELRRAGLQTLGDLEIRRIGDKRMLDPLMASFPVPANSDFYPFVDLNAPRMRFLGRDALDLVRLGHLPVSLAAITGGPLKNSLSTSAAAARFFYRQRLAEQAHAIIRALQNGEPLQDSPEVQDALESLAANPSCKSAEERWRWLNSVYLLASKTSAFLTPLDGSTLWDAVDNSQCRGALQPGEAAWLHQLESLPQANDEALSTFGTKMLGDPPAGLSGKQLIEALIATSGALAMRGRSDEARALLGAYVPMLNSAGDYALALRLVQALAQTSPRP